MSDLISCVFRRHRFPLIAIVPAMVFNATGMAGDEPPTGLAADAWQAIEQQIAEQVDAELVAGDAAQTAIRGGLPDHGLVRTAAIGGDYTGLPDQTAAPGPEFGYSVAMDGDWLAVGAPGTMATGPREVGAVFLFRRIGGGWQLVQRTTPTGSPGAAPRCGTSVAMRLPHLLVGCPGADWPDSEDNENGRAIFFRLSDEDSWEVIANAYFPGTESRCGTQVAVSASGADTGNAVAAFGCPGWNGEQGRIWTRRYVGQEGAWAEEWTAVDASDGAGGDRFGASLAIVRTEVGGVSVQRMAVGAPYKSFPPAFASGKVYIFGGPSWTETDSFTHASPDSFSLTYFGAALAMNNTQLIVGAPGGFTTECPNAPRCGQVYRYERTGATWQHAEGGGAINAGGNPPGEQVGMRFGGAVAIGFDNWVAVAAPNAHGWTQFDGLAEEVGMVELRRAGAGFGGWGVGTNHHRGEVRPATIGALAHRNGHFGTSLAFGGRRLAVGYPHAGVQLIGRRGQVWIYEEDRIFANGFGHPPVKVERSP